MSTKAGEDQTAVMLWPINRQNDSFEGVVNLMISAPSVATYVVRNLYFGSEREFGSYNGSAARDAVEGRGGKSVNFPRMARRLADRLDEEKLSIQAMASLLPRVDLAELNRWRVEGTNVFREVTHDRSR